MAEQENNLTPEQEQELRQLREALVSEFHVAEKESGKKNALSDIEDLKTDFLDAIKYVVKHSTNDALRAKVAMWGYDKLIDEGKADSDPLKKLVDGLEAARAANS